MDPASAAVALLAPYLAPTLESAANAAGQAAVEGAKSLWAALRRKFKGDGDAYAEQTLDRLQEKPEDEARQAALKGVIEEKMNADSAFGKEVSQLVQNSIGGAEVGSFLTQVYGGEVGKIVNIAQADQVTIN